jgi:DnaJ-class molecular chaperone
MNKQQLLEIYRNMTDEELAAELKKQYPKAMKEVHPDLQKPEDREKANRLAALLNSKRDEINQKG